MQKHRQHRNGTFLILAVCMVVLTSRMYDVSAGPQLAAQQRTLGTEELYRVDLLPKMKQALKTGCVSSHDRRGGNDDGFSGKYSFIRKEAGGLVFTSGTITLGR